MATGPPDDEEERPETFREWLILLLRDLAILGLVFAVALGALFAYAQVWPPMVVVESESMQHSDTESFIGIIDTGDYVLVQAAPLPGQVVTWVEGRVQNYRTYGDFGDVIIFRPPTNPADTPIIHRALLRLEWNTTSDDGWDAPSLLGLGRTEWSANRNGTPLSAPYNMNGQLTLRHAGFRGNLEIVVSPTARRVSGFITIGDHNADLQGRLGNSANPDGWIVPQANIIGKARGELPWFGLLKLTIAPEDSCCRSWGDPRAPRNSWDALTLALIVIIAGPIAADFGLSWWQKKRKAAKQEPAAGDVEPSDAVVDSVDAAPAEEPDAGKPPPDGPSH